MQTLLQIGLPTIIIPLLLSVIIWKLNSDYPIAQRFIPVIWLPSYFILTGMPVLPVAEAQDWLWILVSVSTVLTLLFNSQHTILNYLLYLVLSMILFAIAWPVLVYQFSLTLVFEILTIVIIASATHYYLIKTISSKVIPGDSLNLILALSCIGLALVVVLAGSLLIGEFAGILATMFAVLVVLNLIFKKHKITLQSGAIIPLLQLYFAILLLARIYVELSLVLTLLLLLAPISGLVTRQRFGFTYTAIIIISAISWLLISADSSSYY